MPCLASSILFCNQKYLSRLSRLSTYDAIGAVIALHCTTALEKSRKTRRTWSVMSVAVESWRTRHETQRWHVRHVRSEGAEWSSVLGRSAVPATTSAAPIAVSSPTTTSTAWNEIGVSAVARTPTFAPVAVDGSLQFIWWTIFLLLAFVWVQIFHIPV